MIEQLIEKRLVRKAVAHGGKALKFISPGWAGAPDRLVLLPGGWMIFVEVKRPGERLRRLQQKRAKELKALGFQVITVDSMEGIDVLFSTKGGDPLEIQTL